MRKLSLFFVFFLFFSLQTLQVMADDCAPPVLEYSGKTALCVGATSGIGRGIALALAKRGFSVTGVGRSLERGAKLVEDLKALAPSATHNFISCDASLLTNISEMTKEYLNHHDSLDVLVCTQGIATIQGYTPTKENIDMKLAIHYYGRMNFITSLLPILEKSTLDGGGRVLSVLAAGVHPPYDQYQEDPFLKKHYSMSNAANAATMYNDVAADSLARENPTISFFHANPGFVSTNWGTEMPFLIRMAVRAIQPFGRSLEQCGEIMSGALLNPPQNKEKTKTELPNFYLLDQDGNSTTKNKKHDEAREFVWAHTKSVLKEMAENGKLAE
mmetsp:Transcript_20630/g.32217  ORF Transcript_20630/g.32217 Transcript_20630/m.32217 type:complete len:329 (-) Transcript_20630:977-1963(-)